MNYKATLSVLMLTTMLTACSGGGGNNSGNTTNQDNSNSETENESTVDGSNTDANTEDGTDSSANTEDGTDGSASTEDGTDGNEEETTEVTPTPIDEQPKNPFIAGGLPSEPTIFRSTNVWNETAELFIDPDAGTYKLTTTASFATTIKTGSYDAETGQITTGSCTTTAGNGCQAFKSGVKIDLKNENYVHTHFVVLDPNKPEFAYYWSFDADITDPHGVNYIGISPTPIENMPNGPAGQPVTYVGIFNGDFLDFSKSNDPDKGPVLTTGKAVTTVDFGTGSWGVDFDEFTGEYAGSTVHLDGLNIDGNRFTSENSKGAIDMIFIDQNGRAYSGASLYAGGYFFGENAEELGGALFGTFTPDDDKGNFRVGVDFKGAWIGAAQ